MFFSRVSSRCFCCLLRSEFENGWILKGPFFVEGLVDVMFDFFVKNCIFLLVLRCFHVVVVEQRRNLVSNNGLDPA